MLTLENVIDPTPERLKLAARLLVKMSPEPNGCIRWTGRIDHHGYSEIRITLGRLKYRKCRAHRVAYEVFVGPIPEGLTIDHLCRNQWCVNPAHLEPVTSVVNVMRGESPFARHARKTHCKHGHEFTPENTYHPRGIQTHRKCRECARQKDRRLLENAAFREKRQAYHKQWREARQAKSAHDAAACGAED